MVSNIFQTAQRSRGLVQQDCTVIVCGCVCMWVCEWNVCVGVSADVSGRELLLIVM